MQTTYENFRNTLLKEFQAMIESACKADDLRKWADEMFERFPVASNAEHKYSDIPGDLGFQPLRKLTNGVPATFTIRYDKTGRPERADVIWGFGRLIEGVSVFSSAETGKAALNERAMYKVGIAPRVYVWQLCTN